MVGLLGVDGRESTSKGVYPKVKIKVKNAKKLRKNYSELGTKNRRNGILSYRFSLIHSF